MNFFIEMLYLFVIVVHHRLFGDPTVTYVATDRTVTLQYTVRDNVYTFVSTQYICTVIHTGILRYKSKSYYYKVKLNTNATNVHGTLEKCYRCLCPRFLKNTTYPHRLAINAHFKAVTGKL